MPTQKKISYRTAGGIFFYYSTEFRNTIANSIVVRHTKHFLCPSLNTTEKVILFYFTKVYIYTVFIILTKLIKVTKQIKTKEKG